MKIDDYGQFVIDIARMSCEHDPMPPWALALKTGEEVGEFHTAILYELGFLRHKVMKDTPFEEAADVMNCLIATLANLYPNKTPEQIGTALMAAHVKKAEVYASRIGQRLEDLCVQRDGSQADGKNSEA